MEDLQLRSLKLNLYKILRSFHCKKQASYELRCFWVSSWRLRRLIFFSSNFLSWTLTMVKMMIINMYQPIWQYVPAVSVVLQDDCCWWLDPPASLSRCSLCLNHCLCSFQVSVSGFQAFLFSPPGTWFPR